MRGRADQTDASTVHGIADYVQERGVFVRSSIMERGWERSRETEDMRWRVQWKSMRKRGVGVERWKCGEADIADVKQAGDGGGKQQG